MRFTEKIFNFLAHLHREVYLSKMSYVDCKLTKTAALSNYPAKRQLNLPCQNTKMIDF